MSLARYAKKRDQVEDAIVEALILAGCRVWRIDRPFDLIVGLGGRLSLLECKTGNAPLTPQQAAELAGCQFEGLPVYVVRTPEEALAAVRGW